MEFQFLYSGKLRLSLGLFHLKRQYLYKQNNSCGELFLSRIKHYSGFKTFCEMKLKLDQEVNWSGTSKFRPAMPGIFWTCHRKFQHAYENIQSLNQRTYYTVGIHDEEGFQ